MTSPMYLVMENSYSSADPTVFPTTMVRALRAGVELAERARGTGTSSRRVFDLLHELEADATGSLDERNPSNPERSRHGARPPQHGVTGQFSIEIVDEECRMQESLRAGSRHTSS